MAVSSALIVLGSIVIANTSYDWIGICFIGFGINLLVFVYGRFFEVKVTCWLCLITIITLGLAVSVVKQERARQAEQKFKQYQKDLAAQQEKERTATIKMRLRAYYQEVNELLHVPVGLEDTEAFEAHLANCKHWFSERSKWIGENMGEAARIKFLDTVGTQIIIPKGADERPRMLKAILARLKDNLEDLMKEDSWASLP